MGKAYFNPNRPKCGAKLRNGGTCKRWPMLGQTRCDMHGGKHRHTTTGWQTKAFKKYRMIRAAEKKYLKWQLALIEETLDLARTLPSRYEKEVKELLATKKESEARMELLVKEGHEDTKRLLAKEPWPLLEQAKTWRLHELDELKAKFKIPE